MLNIQKTGMAVGAYAGLVHFVWSLLVWFGWAQGLVDWMMGLHFIEPIFVVTDFDFLTMIYLVIVAAIMGYIFGTVFAWVLNMANKGNK
jgi:hypothetical protein